MRLLVRPALYEQREISPQEIAPLARQLRELACNWLDMDIVVDALPDDERAELRAAREERDQAFRVNTVLQNHRDAYAKLWHRDAELLRRALKALDEIGGLEYEDPELEGFQVADEARGLAHETAQAIRQERIK